MTSGGDDLFSAAVLAQARSATPRDGGVALRALADWLTEQFNEGRTCVAVADTATTGFFLVVVKTSGVYAYECYLVGGSANCFELKSNAFRNLIDTRKRQVKSSTFIGWTEEVIREFWQAS